MGADFFTCSGPGVNVAEAFRFAQEEACDEYGRRGYTGSLAEKPGYHVVDRKIRWRADADKWAYARAGDNDDKWGPAWAVPFAEPRDGEQPVTRTVTVTVTVKGDPSGSHAVRDAVTAKVHLRQGERIGQIRLDNTVPVYKHTAVAPKGKTVTRYIVTGTSNRDAWGLSQWVSRHDSWENGWASQAEARAALLAWLEQRDENTGNETFDIQAVTRREDGSPLVQVQRILKSATYTATVVVAKVPPVPKRIDGWLFYGWASS